jgi:uncharacterized membrane protein YphA (DoxX/SURF4 family)
MAFETAGAAEAFLIGRVAFGLVVAFTGLNHFANGDGMVPYARAKGVPAAGLAVPFTGGVLIFGGVAVAVGAYPVLGAGAIALFLLVTTPVMHDFWAAPEDERQGEMTDFLKNGAMLGAAVALLALGSTPWPYAVNVGLF